MNTNITILIDNINFLLKKINFENINESDKLIEKIIIQINKAHNLVNEIINEKKISDNPKIEINDIQEFQNILISSINDENTNINTKKEDILQYIKNLNIINNNIQTKDLKMDKIISNDNKPILNEKSINIEESNLENTINNEFKKNKKKIENVNKEKDNKNNTVKNETQKIKIKRVFDNTENEIEGEYNKITYQSKINKKTLSAYTFCYKKNEIITKFLYKNSSKNKEFYNCFKSGKGCLGKA